MALPPQLSPGAGGGAATFKKKIDSISSSAKVMKVWCERERESSAHMSNQFEVVLALKKTGPSCSKG